MFNTPTRLAHISPYQNSTNKKLSPPTCTPQNDWSTQPKTLAPCRTKNSLATNTHHRHEHSPNTLRHPIKDTQQHYRPARHAADRHTANNKKRRTQNTHGGQPQHTPTPQQNKQRKNETKTKRNPQHNQPTSQKKTDKSNPTQPNWLIQPTQSINSINQPLYFLRSLLLLGLAAGGGAPLTGCSKHFCAPLIVVWG